jgi:hypothetical protein
VPPEQRPSIQQNNFVLNLIAHYATMDGILRENTCWRITKLGCGWDSKLITQMPVPLSDAFSHFDLDYFTNKNIYF